ncbi:methyltransferase domain-containing protein [Starkeya koreensis]|uniref:Methyltransferase domain-containing protein n=1 Tax=Ancylobacter koreensis TaxID=266121 RepID=A0ABT0DQM0_9HYPH|nr:methyltransferase domain-containing protein [Ancylobacter koreensis]
MANYISCDLNPGVADQVVDIQDIPFPDKSFDIIWCSHVLEHVPDDRKAMREIHRVLRDGGTALIQIPVWHEVTDEDPSIIDKQERIRRFYQADHVRLYGDDVDIRLKEAGFSVRTVRPHHFEPEIVFRNQIAQPGNYEIFLCTK